MNSHDKIKEMVRLKDFVKNHTGSAALYELLSEECLELAFWAAKTARIMRDEVPTPISLMKSFDNVAEEYCDVTNVIFALGVSYPDIDKRIMKMRRWKERIEDREAEIANGAHSAKS